MSSSEKFCLRWNDFESNISGAFRELREDKDFFDVTLACDDDQMQAHKVILSACSPFFRSILRRNKHEHPLLYLKGVKYTDLVSVLTFMYQGEVNVAQEELNSFLAVAEDLKVKGLTQNYSETKVKTPRPSVTGQAKPYAKDPPDRNPPPKRSQPQPPLPAPRARAPPPTAYQEENDEIQEVDPVVKSEPLPVQSEPPTPTSQYSMVEQAYQDTNQQQQQVGIMEDPNMEYGEEYGDYGGYEGVEGGYDNSGVEMQDGNKDLDELIAKSMSLIVDETGSRVWTCHLCNRTNKHKSDIRRHMEIHLEIQNQCPHCDKQVQTREALRKHIYRYHKY